MFAKVKVFFSGAVLCITLTWRRPFPSERSKTQFHLLSGQTEASHLSPAADRQSRRPPTRQTARTVENRAENSDTEMV